MSRRALVLCAGALLAACAGQGSSPGTGTTSASGHGSPASTSPPGPGSPTATTAPLPPATTAAPAYPEKKPDPKGEIGTAAKYKQDPKATPSSCADVGDHVGYASCCQGKYCAGFCDEEKGCECGQTSGCLWPEVCGGSCVGPKAAVVYGHDSEGHLKAYSALTGKEDMGQSSAYVNQVQLVNEGDTCGIPEPKTLEEKKKHQADQRHWTCCQGKKCPGFCLKRAGDAAPHCECAGLEGGCVAPHVCCGNGYSWSSCRDESTCPTEIPWP
jgi:hypothetical protein